MKITLMAGGIGAGKLAEGLVYTLNSQDLTIVVNVGDDSEMHNLYICPDFDIIVYTLAGIIDPENRWGISNDSYNCLSMLKKYTLKNTWFNLGDKDLGTHIFRTMERARGKRLTEIAQTITKAHNVGATILPCTDDELRTKIHSGDRLLDFEEYFVKERAVPVADKIVFSGSDQARATPEVKEALMSADKIIIAPSNPYLSIDPILAVKEIHDILVQRRSDSCFVSPIVGGKAIKGPTAKIMEEQHVTPNCVSVAAHYKEVASIAFIDTVDSSLVNDIEAMNYKVFTFNTIMDNIEKKIDLAKFILDTLNKL